MKLIQTIKNIWKIDDLRKRLTITFLFVLVYRLGCHVVMPGIDPAALEAMRRFTSSSGLMQLLDMFSGGAFTQASPRRSSSNCSAWFCRSSRRCNARVRVAA